jgi:hypothetical protein
VFLITLALIAVLDGRVGRAEQTETFRARLSAVPIDAGTALKTLGSGSVAGVLDGKTLVIRGTFEDLNSPATAAHIHRAKPGLRGENVLTLSVTRSKSGVIEGRFTLTDAQAADLRKGWFYVQLHTEENPDGHLRGWLLE